MDRKRAFDLLLAMPALVASLPLQVVVAVMVARKLGRPVLFRQQRPGLAGAPFEMVKFRTMLPIDPGNGVVDDSDRMTGFGRFLRSTSIDELPSLWSVVRGEMSLVGPRPLLMHYLPLYSDEQARRHDVRPGLTGLAQVSGRNALTWEQKFALDVEYVDTHTLRGDIAILWATVGKVIKRDGIAADDSVTMPMFTGSPSKPGCSQSSDAP